MLKIRTSALGRQRTLCHSDQISNTSCLASYLTKYLRCGTCLRNISGRVRFDLYYLSYMLAKIRYCVMFYDNAEKPRLTTIPDNYADKADSRMECYMRIINFSDARSSLRAVIDQVVEDADVTVISRRDAPDAVVMSFDHYSSLMETVHLLSSPANAAHLAKSIAQALAGYAQHRELFHAADTEDSEDAQRDVHG